MKKTSLNWIGKALGFALFSARRLGQRDLSP